MSTAVTPAVGPFLVACALLVLGGDLRVIAVSPSFCRTFRVLPEQTIGRTGGEQQPGGERCLAGIAVAHHTDVPNVLAFVDFHGGAPLFKTA